jgi:hypothetical protein
VKTVKASFIVTVTVEVPETDAEVKALEEERAEVRERHLNYDDQASMDAVAAANDLIALMECYGEEEDWPHKWEATDPALVETADC